jgi:hypothetical protein
MSDVAERTISARVDRPDAAPTNLLVLTCNVRILSLITGLPACLHVTHAVQSLEEHRSRFRHAVSGQKQTVSCARSELSRALLLAKDPEN